LEHRLISADVSEKNARIAWVYLHLSVRTRTLLAADLRTRGEFRQRSIKARRASE
jgi:hypothetical protein